MFAIVSFDPLREVMNNRGYQSIIKTTTMFLIGRGLIWVAVTRRKFKE